MKPERTKKISKYMSKILRHSPEKIGLTLDANGWAEIHELLAKSGMSFTRDELQTVVDTNDKKRFVISDDCRRIRASQGHSINIDLGLQPVEPPEILYHGTAERALPSIMEQGLQPRNRDHVHLSDNIETATKVGMRHGKPVVLRVLAKELHAQGQDFFQSDNGVWLSAWVPPAALRPN